MKKYTINSLVSIIVGGVLICSSLSTEAAAACRNIMLTNGSVAKFLYLIEL